MNSETLKSLTPDEIHLLLQDLNVHQIELEMQNEELRRTQEALEVSRARYFELYDLAPIGYVTITERGLIQEANLAAATLLGQPRGTLVERPLSGFILPEDQDSFYRCRQRVFATGDWQSCELRLRRPGGEPFPIRLEFALGKERESELTHCLITLNDLGERKRTEAARLAEAVQREENQRKDCFLAMLGHELRNPLAPIRHIAEILRLAPSHEPGQIAQVARILARQVDHLTRLVDDLLDVASINRGALRISKRPCDLREAVEQAAEQVRSFLDERQQRLELTLPATPLILDGDPLRLSQIVVNLLRNASQFSLPEALIALTLESVDGAAVLRVRDWGKGLTPSQSSRIFEPFVQAEQTSERRQGGLGLGLALIKGLAELHGGSVAVASPGLAQGSTFTLRLPQSSMPLAPALPDSEPKLPTARRILIVDDNPDVLTGCALLLRLLGHQVDTEQSGLAALATVERLCPDLILLDLGLPGMNGFEVARRLRTTAAGRAARLVAITGYGQHDDRQKSSAAGFDEHLLKPVGQDTLLALLERCPGAAPGY
jgi:PAS domain S-box-containing protein